jgi:hypothetical protein
MLTTFAIALRDPETGAEEELFRVTCDRRMRPWTPPGAELREIAPPAEPAETPDDNAAEEA